MTEQEMKNAITIIAMHYGMKAQSMQACEECAELNNLAEEIADVRMRIPEAEVSECIDEKLKRQLERIREASHEHA